MASTNSPDPIMHIPQRQGGTGPAAPAYAAPVRLAAAGALDEREPTTEQAAAYISLQLAAGTITLAELPPATLDLIEAATVTALTNAEVTMEADIYSLLVLCQVFAQKMKESENMQRFTALQAAELADLAAADLAEESAYGRRDAAVLENSLDMAQGITDLGMGAAQGRAGYKAGKASVREQQFNAAAEKTRLSRPEDHARLTQLKTDVEAIKGSPGWHRDPAKAQQFNAKQMEIDRLEGRAADHDSNVHNERANKLTYDKQKTIENAISTLSRGLGQMIHSAGGMAAANVRLDADLADAEAKRVEATGSASRTAAEFASMLVQTATDCGRQARTTLTAIEDDRHGLNRAISSNIKS